jgi:hypothetical protein
MGELKVVAWRYQDSRGHYRYRGPREGFDTEYAILKPIALTSHQAATEAIKELKGRLEEAERDAARYRWLREGRLMRQGQDVGVGSRLILESPLRARMEFKFWCTPEELDTAIDAAIRNGGEG